MFVYLIWSNKGGGNTATKGVYVHTEHSTSWQTSSKHSNKKRYFEQCSETNQNCCEVHTGGELSTVLNQVNCGLQPSKESLGKRLPIFPKIFVASDQQSLFLCTEWVYYRKDLALKFLFSKTYRKIPEGLTIGNAIYCLWIIGFN